MYLDKRTLKKPDAVSDLKSRCNHIAINEEDSSLQNPILMDRIECRVGFSKLNAQSWILDITSQYGFSHTFFMTVNGDCPIYSGKTLDWFLN